VDVEGPASISLLCSSRADGVLDSSSQLPWSVVVRDAQIWQDAQMPTDQGSWLLLTGPTHTSHVVVARAAAVSIALSLSELRSCRCRVLMMLKSFHHMHTMHVLPSKGWHRRLVSLVSFLLQHQLAVRVLGARDVLQ
jgi:hypothetical protein